jgi:hypothetical protein
MCKWDCLKLKSLCTTNEIVTSFQRQPKEWEKTFASFSSAKGLTSRIYRELKKLNYQRINNPMKQ